ncbi:MAG TPA: amino acid adenylation domain-containing protein, partial [Bryobacteraceae bacterium]|nr:amino acid adenylation domain-containing protein [Bryobacteraceae bacterium]
MYPSSAVSTKQAETDRPNGAPQPAELSNAERDSLIELGDGGPSVASIPDSEGRCLYDLVAAQAERSPEAIAVIEQAGEMTYRQLVQRANGLAHRLRELGVAAETRVAILTDRSAESLVGLLGILAAGAAYVPLDPAHPDERLAFVLADASTRVLLTPAALTERANSVAQRALPANKLVIVAAPPASASPPPSSAVPANAAYVIYTSGSTGTPKGVVVEHRGAVNLVESFIARHNFAGHRLLMIPPLFFDASVGDIFPALAVGGTLVLHPAPAELGCSELEQFCREFRITAIDAPTALWRRWTEGFAASAHNDALLPHLALLMFGGESVSLEQVRRFAQLTQNRVLLANHYGPTEASVCAAMLTTRDGSELSGADLPIGRPLPGVRVYLLDEHLRLAPRGAEGELCIGGVGVARAYLGMPDLSAERFIRDPFSPDPAARMYRTGDLARWNADGTLQFIGRRDDQVKIRGVRIELGEIEARLAEHPGVREAAVLAREDHPGDKRLVAYVTPAGAAEIDVEALRAYLAALLPDYMVPAAYVSLAKLPLTPNGKLDRKALPPPDSNAYLTRGYEAPRGEVETTVARIWAEVLNLERMGRNDNFFELGGHSVLAVTVIERMRAAGLPVDVRALFAAPTLKDLAEAAGSTEARSESQAVVVPPNLIPAGCTAITPAMLPLVTLSQSDIDRIVATVPGGAANVQDIYPLAPLQEGILFHHLLDKQGDVYLAPTLFGIDTREHANRYLDALRQVIARHDTLRTAVVWEGLPEPLQVVWRHAPLIVEEVALDPAAGDIAGQLRARFDPRHYRLDVRQAPLWRLFLTEDAPNRRWVMLELMHHLAGDHVTLQVMQQEIQTIVQGRAERLPAPLPFRNFVAQARLGVSREEHEAFFTRLLGDVDEPTAPFGLTDVQGDGSQIAEGRRAVDPELCRRLRVQARAWGVTTASLCHLACALVLARSSGRDDVVFGTVMFGRAQAGEGAGRVMGIFINTLPVRITLAQESVRVSARNTHGLLTQLLRHEHAPLALAQRCSSVHAPAPLFTSLLNYRYVAAGEAVLVRDAVTLQDGGNPGETPPSMQLLEGQERTNYPLCLYVNDFGQAFSLEAQVDASIDPQRVCAMMYTALESLVTGLERDPAAPVSGLDVLPAAERRQLLVSWNDTSAAYTKNRCIHELFEAQAVQAPAAIALACEGQTLSYGELNRRANRLAHYLQHLGVKPDDRVALCAERGLEMVVAILAVLKAGGGYVPLDPAYPVERLAYMLEDSAPAVLLVHLSADTRHALSAILTTASIPVVDLEADARAWADERDWNPGALGLQPQHLAYVIYTSGSTGAPKGVMVEHANVVRLFTATDDWFHFDGRDVWTLFHSYAFDFSVWELWGALAYGGKLVVVPQLTTRSPEEFYRLLCAEGVTILNQTPSAFRQLIAAQGNDGRLHRLRHVIFGGEALEVSTLRPWYEREINRATRLINMYGITETTVHVTYRPLEAADTTAPGASPIGCRIPDLATYILDRHRQPVPIGVAGELYVGGAGVARGYLNRPKLTEERFLADPFSADPQARMYRTGDVARFRADGQIEYLGRNDHQVKIRGFRIELGEIEARLADHPSVREAAVLAREDQAGDKRLVAYVAPAGAAEIDVEALRSHLSALLPDYMVPAAYVSLAKLPLTPNGKLDRKALPAPDSDAYLTRGYEAPVGAVESTVARIWAEVLKLERVGRNDNFFELGGHSLLAVTVIERMRAAALPVDVRALFAAPTLKGLAEAIGSTEARSESPVVEIPPNLIPAGCTAITPAMLPLVALSQSDIDRIVATVPGGAANVQDIYPLAPLQEGILFHHLLNKQGDVYLTTTLLAAPARENLYRYAEALQAVIARHDILRTAVAWESLPEPVQVVWRHAPLVVEEVALDPAAGDIAGQLRARFDPRHYRLDVRQAPLWRLFLTEDAPNRRWVLLELTHHLIDDNTSIRFLLAEIQAIMNGQPERLPAPLPFRNFVAQARLGVSREEHEAFFTRLLGDVDEPTAPFGLTDVQGDGSHIAEGRRDVDPELCRRLRVQARALGVTTASLCHLAWALVLARTSGREDVVFGTVLFGRMQGGEGAGRAIGMFINTLPLRIKLGQASVRAAARETHALLTQLLRHEHATLALAQRCSLLQSPAPLFTSLLNYRHLR